MKAIVYHRYGSPDVLACEDVQKPAPGDDEVLIRVRAASLNPMDRHFMRGEPRVARLMLGLRRPKDTRIGVDVAGVVEAVGKNVTRFKSGDEVFGSSRGAFAEYAVTAESALATKPVNATFEQAAAVPVGAYTALQALRNKGRIQAGQKVLVNGAAGGVGTFAVQIARSFGAEVTGVCSTRNVELLRSIGADQVIDYTREDFTKLGQRYDLILDAIGNHSLSEFRRVLQPKGTYVMIGDASGRLMAGLGRALKALLLSSFVSQRLVMVMAKRSMEDLAFLRELIEAGKVTPVIDRIYPLNEVAAAMRHLEEGHARGKVIITLAERTSTSPAPAP